ncbi:MAG: tRNA guanosine(34) transglycosylase Tgt [Planctomycetes bacterium]|nr:tRNA guanosine(34) transglycosylase Tgt [Planctomycetota bacterium]
MFGFSIIKTDGKARRGVLRTAHGEVPTPVFMPCATYGAVKGITPEQLHSAGVKMILANAYHLLLRPGVETIVELGGLHKFMGWDGPILTDSGGYQVFSLAALRKVSDDAVVFQSHIDGETIELTPERCIEVQIALGADIIMQLDECPPADADEKQVARAVERTVNWSRRCKETWLKSGNPSIQTLFAIQQGGTSLTLREKCIEALKELDFPGFAIGGLSVGEKHEEMAAVLETVDDSFPSDKPRYLMGVGEPRDILLGVSCGIDMFDCVLPTRNARNAQAFTWSGRIRLRNSTYARDARPIDENCPCYTCKNFSRGTLRHYFQINEMLAAVLVTIHNLTFFAQLMSEIHKAIDEGNLQERIKVWLKQFYPSNDEG